MTGDVLTLATINHHTLLAAARLQRYIITYTACILVPASLNALDRGSRSDRPRYYLCSPLILTYDLDLQLTVRASYDFQVKNVLLQCISPVKSRLVLPSWYWLTRVVPDKGPLNGCVCVCAMYFSYHACAFSALILLVGREEEHPACKIE